ncbi:glycosyltransferase family 4 protein [Bacteroides graminisolvens]|uniref:glycosyltransferase family 4 protein n=1 Tax=Bacteroides graminisolvens TaxID=477666 RepID=UPI0024099B03|nr:glycosyltransferase family 1 protein [Bacteroides graminisolvens]
MKVLYDYQAFENRYSGISNCFVQLISNLPQDVLWNIGCKQSVNVHLLEKNLISDIKRPLINEGNFIVNKHFYGKKTLYNILNRYMPLFLSSYRINMDYSIECLKKQDYDVFHPTYQNDYFLNYIKNKPIIFTVHDFIPESFPQYFDLRRERSKYNIIKKSKHIIAVSHHTKKDIIRFMGVKESKISVIYHGAPEPKNISIESNRIVAEEYFLYVGMRGGYKNFISFIKVCALFIKNHPNVMIVCTGMPFTKNEMELIESLDIKSNVVNMFVTDSELLNLYKYAIAFIYPSLYEGFGIPILESFSQGCLTLLNNKSCFPEIGGDAALYFVLDETQNTLLDRLYDAYYITDLERQSFKDKSRERLKLFSWTQSAKRLSDCYKTFIF